MSLEDPFFVVRDEVVSALAKARNYYQRWSDYQSDPNCVTKDEIEWITTELRNGLRSIEWDLEDLEETIGIVEANPRKFKLDDNEISNRRKFIMQTKDEVKFMRDKLFDSKTSKTEKSALSMLRPSNNVGNTTNGAKYMRLQNLDATQNFVLDGISMDDTSLRQTIGLQDGDPIDKVREGVGVLKSNNQQIANDTDEHAVMLDELGNEVEVVESRFDTTLKKVARVLHLTNDRRQWTALGALVTLLVIFGLVTFI